METLVAVAQHRHQYYSKSKSPGPDSFSSPSRGFREINCRTFQSGAGILPTPLKYPISPSATKKPCSSPQTPLYVNSQCEDEDKSLKNSGKSRAIPINFKEFNKERPFNDDLSFSELWAGPAYSNSPPPSSLPIPKFSLRQKRTVSLDLPVSNSGIKMHPIAKSAPPSPSRESHKSPGDFFLSTDSATKNLRRILHLDLDDDE
ncbi:hypothetical protein HHK36_022716 [Tetracentron sinense]|uniref:Uncharacterized protein n=1 Tax=Tetracentron sinense TaxID=13715 RepID=A0A835D9W5_TETSI|nr:hypothetical protein HHK36_022716 [Tetracentron sinense]